jgi:ubiquinone biosynthesis protein
VNDLGARQTYLARATQIAAALLGFGWALRRLRKRAPERLPERLRQTLEGLGTTFVKLGQGLSLRRDLLPTAYLEALEHLHSEVAAFDGALAVAIIERSFDSPIDSLFSEFDRSPFAAGSVAQVHRARMPDGRDVAVKVRRPGIADQVDLDLRLLRHLAKIAQLLIPALRRQRPLELIDELATVLRNEIDMAHEARNMRRLDRALQGADRVTLPRVIEPLAAEQVIVQEFSHGTPIADSYGSERGRDLARTLLDAYVFQLFSAGVFHADPHPGNLFEMGDGRLCMHDIGSIGVLDPQARRSLALMIEAIVHDDAEGVLDATIAMGFISPAIDRREHQRAISEILGELRTLPLNQWSVAEAIWRVARVGAGAHFRLPRHLLVLVRTLFLAEHTLRALDPALDLPTELAARSEQIAQAFESGPSRPLTERLSRTVEALPELFGNALRQLRIDDGRLPLAVHHRGLDELEATLARTGNRLAVALVTLGLYLTGSLLMLHRAGPMLAGHVPWLAAAAYGIAFVLSLRLVFAIARSGHL